MKIDEILEDHKRLVEHGFDSINLGEFQRTADVIVDAIKGRKRIFTCGNGASAAIAQHWACDYFKGCSKGDLAPQVYSLSANIPLMTAISNDISYDEVYSYQIERAGEIGDVLIVISSSGNSPSVVKAIDSAMKKGMLTVALTGFNGGACWEKADFVVHVDIQEYEATEDVHQAVMHMIAKYVRAKLWA